MATQKQLDKVYMQNAVEEIEEEIWEKKLEVEELKQELANLKE